MQRSMIVLLLIWCAQMSWAGEQNPPKTLTVLGKGEVNTVPDIVSINVSLRQEAKKASKAMTSLTELSDNLIIALLKFGLETKDLRTRGLRLERYYKNDSYKKREFLGFRAETTLVLTVRDLEKLGQIFDLLLEENVEEMGGLNFSSSRAGVLREKARREAVKNARKKAMIYAQESGVILGDVIKISDKLPAQGFAKMRGAVLMSDATQNPVAAGEIGFGQTVEMVFEIQPAQE